MRGFAWALVRWLADRTAPGEEVEMIRRLSDGGPGHVSGVENVIQAAGGSWDALLADFLLALGLDDADLEGEAAGRGIATWDLRDVFAELASNPGTRSNFPLPFPLNPTRIPFGSGSVEFETSASTAAWFRLGDPGEGGAMTLQLAGRAGGGSSTPSAPILAVVRVQ